MRKGDRFLAGLLFVGLGFLFGYLAAAKIRTEVAKDGWDIATAVGTVGAVIVALWQNWQQRRDRTIEFQERAHIVAATRVIGLHAFRMNAYAMQVCADKFLSTLPDADLLFDNDVAMFGVMSNPILDISTDELLTLFPVAPKLVMDFAVNLGHLRHIRSDLSVMRNNWDAWDSGTKHAVLTMWGRAASAAHESAQKLETTVMEAFKAY